MPRTPLCILMLLIVSGIGCRQCGERQGLFSRLRDRLDGDDDNRSDALRGSTGRDCGPDGRPVSRKGNGSGFGTGEVIYVGPSYPAGQPQPYNSRPDELPQPGGYIPSPGVPMNPYAQPRPVDSTKLLPKPGGTMTGDPKK